MKLTHLPKQPNPQPHPLQQAPAPHLTFLHPSLLQKTSSCLDPWRPLILPLQHFLAAACLAESPWMYWCRQLQRAGRLRLSLNYRRI